MAHNPRKRTHQLGVEVEDATFFWQKFMANVEGFKAVTNRFCSNLEVAIINSYGGYAGL
jgi:hypothetical protein